jgi:hypothetical protein
MESGGSMKKLKLFCLRWGKGGQMVCDIEGNPTYFDDKTVAKQHRDWGEHMVVSYGIDHKKYNYIKGDVR